MNKLEKPKFKFSTIEKTGTLFGIVCSLLTFWWFTWYYAVIIFLILLLIVLLCNIIDYCMQTNKLYKEYTNTYENHSALSKQFKCKSSKIAEQNELLYQYDFILNDIINIVTLKTVSTSEKENEFLMNFNKILLQQKKYLYNFKKGDNENE